MLQRMLVEKIENRILVGIVMFVGIMVMLGWVAINENARMQSFTRQFEARSIESGAKLFAANCSTCHGNDGRGINGRAPGLNNPVLFGHDFIAVDRKTRDDAQKKLTDLNEERISLQEELISGEVTDARKAEIEARVQAIDTELVDTQAALDAAQLKIDTFATSVQLAIDNAYDINASSRLAQANWPGTLDAYIFTTLVHGRPQNANLWGGNIMSPWSQSAGGPLRDDQLRDLVAYITNWDKGDDWTVEDLLSVNQFAQVPGASGAGRPEITADPAGTNVTAITEAVLATTGDPARGEQLYNNREWSQRAERLGCSGCHAGAVQAPDTTGTWDRVIDERLTEPQFAGYTVEQYLIESIVLPNEYVVAGYNAGIMPQNFGERTSVQDLADIIAYLRTTSATFAEGAESPNTGTGGGSESGADANTESGTGTGTDAGSGN